MDTISEKLRNKGQKKQRNKKEKAQAKYGVALFLFL